MALAGGVDTSPKVSSHQTPNDLFYEVVGVTRPARTPSPERTPASSTLYEDARSVGADIHALAFRNIITVWSRIGLRQ